MFREHEYSGNTNIPGTRIFREHKCSGIREHEYVKCTKCTRINSIRVH